MVLTSTRDVDIKKRMKEIWGVTFYLHIKTYRWTRKSNACLINDMCKYLHQSIKSHSTHKKETSIKNETQFHNYRIDINSNVCVSLRLYYIIIWQLHRIEIFSQICVKFSFSNCVERAEMKVCFFKISFEEKCIICVLRI